MIRLGYTDTQVWKEQQCFADRKLAGDGVLEFEKAFISRMKLIGIPMYAKIIGRDFLEIVHSTLGLDLPSRKCWEMIGLIGEGVSMSRSIPVEWGVHEPSIWYVK